MVAVYKVLVEINGFERRVDFEFDLCDVARFYDMGDNTVAIVFKDTLEYVIDTNFADFAKKWEKMKLTEDYKWVQN